MIAKGSIYAGSRNIADYLTTAGKGERAELGELRGFASDNLRDACTDIEIQAGGTRCEKPFFHTYVRLPHHEHLSREQWAHVADRIETALGFEGQPRAIAFHHLDEGTTHMHVAWSRIDTENMRAIDPGLYKNKLKECCRELEIELGLTRVKNERDSDEKTRSAGRDEFEQSRRLGTDLKAVREGIRACWERTSTGEEFQKALEDEGMMLSRGDRRPFVIIDREGGDHALSKRITGATAAETRERMSDLDYSNLPSVAEAKDFQQDRYHSITNAKDIIDWDDKVAAAGIARADKDDEDRRAALAGLKKAARADDKTLRKTEDQKFWSDYRDTQDAATVKRTETGEKKRADEIGRASPNPLPQIETGLSGTFSVASNVVGAVLQSLEDFCDALIDALAGTTPPREIPPGEFAASPEARAEYRAQQAAEREAERARSLALDRLREDIEKGRHLDPESVKNLAPADHVNIKAKGEAHLVQIIEDHEREKARQNELGGRERER